jgi:uncharacterized protein YkwD
MINWKIKFAQIMVCAVFGAILLINVPAQRKVKIKKSVANKISSNREYSGNLLNDERLISNLINSERRKKGLSELIWDERLANLARSYSRKMAKESFFSHYDRDGDSVIERTKDSNIIGWSKIGENLFLCEGYGTFDTLAVRGWMNSPEHRQNILDRQFNSTGIGIAQSKGGKIYITQVFIEN